MNTAPLSTTSLMRYGVLAAPVAFAGFPLYVLAPDYYATTYGLSLSTLGFALLLLRLFDAFQDPLIGMISDRYRGGVDKLLPAAAVILVMSIYGLFTLQYFTPLIWFVVSIGLAVTAYSFLTINLNALGALWTNDEREQTRIAGMREAFGLLGLVFAVLLPGLISLYVPTNEVYQWFGLALFFLMALALVSFLSWYRTVFKPNFQGRLKIQSNVFFKLHSLPASMKQLLLVYLLSMIASSIPAVLVIFYVRDLLGAESYTGLFLLLYFLSGAAIIPLWKQVSQRYGKYKSWFFSMLLASCSFVWAFFLSEGDVWQYGVICFVSGAALGADLLFPPSILADQLHASKAEHSAARHYASLTLTAKASLALASAVALPTLEGFGFRPDIQNSAEALYGLSLSYALVPCGIKAGAALLLWLLFIRTSGGGHLLIGDTRVKNTHNPKPSGIHHRRHNYAD